MATDYHPFRNQKLTDLKNKRLAAMEIRVKREAAALRQPGDTLEQFVARTAPLQAKIAQEEFQHFGSHTQDYWTRRNRMLERLGTMHLGFRGFGSNIFDMSRLAPLFAHTDVDDVEMSELKLPYSGFFIHFGPETGIDVSKQTGIQGSFIEGAYIVHTSDPDEHDRPTAMVAYVCSNPTKDQAAEMTFGETLIRETNAVFSIVRLDAAAGASINDEELSDGIPELYKDTDVMRAAHRMLINGLCFLNMYEADIETRWPADAPEAWVAGAARPNKGDATKWEGKLLARGYTKVHFCGGRMNLQPTTDTSGHDGVVVEPHWRRGHWRQQAHGPGRTERRRLWILPMIINRHLGMPERGRVYDIDPDDAPNP